MFPHHQKKRKKFQRFFCFCFCFGKFSDTGGCPDWETALNWAQSGNHSGGRRCPKGEMPLQRGRRGGASLSELVAPRCIVLAARLWETVGHGLRILRGGSHRVGFGLCPIFETVPEAEGKMTQFSHEQWKFWQGCEEDLGFWRSSAVIYVNPRVLCTRVPQG